MANNEQQVETREELLQQLRHRNILRKYFSTLLPKSTNYETLHNFK